MTSEKLINSNEVTSDYLASRLEKEFGVRPAFWLNVQIFAGILRDLRGTATELNQALQRIGQEKCRSVLAYYVEVIPRDNLPYALLASGMIGQPHLVKSLIRRFGCQDLTMAFCGVGYNGNVKHLKYFLREFSDPTVTEQFLGMKSLHLLATLRGSTLKGKLSVTRRAFDLLKDIVPPDDFARYLDTALDIAAEHGHVKLVKFLVGRGARTLDRALIYVVKRNQHELALFLISRGANVGEATLMVLANSDRETAGHLQALLQ